MLPPQCLEVVLQTELDPAAGSDGLDGTSKPGSLKNSNRHAKVRVIDKIKEIDTKLNVTGFRDPESAGYSHIEIQNAARPECVTAH
jgi:hypothetical protein